MRGRYLGPAALSGRHGRSSWWVPFGARAYLCATEHLREVTSDAADCLGLDQRRQWDELLKAAREMPENYEDLTSQLGHPQPVEVPTEPLKEPEEPPHDDMDAVEQMTPLEGAGGKGSSIEIGQQSTSWDGRQASTGQSTPAEIPYGERRKDLSSKGLEGPLEDEQEKAGEDETESIGPGEVLMTRSPEKPDASTASSVLDKRLYGREISFHQLPEKDVPLNHEADRAQWDEWVTQISQNSFTSGGSKDSSAGSQRKMFALKISVSK